jgi:hypothetical protein
VIAVGADLAAVPETRRPELAISARITTESREPNRKTRILFVDVGAEHGDLLDAAQYRSRV